MVIITLTLPRTLKLLKLSGTPKEKSVLNDAAAKSGARYVHVGDWSPLLH